MQIILEDFDTTPPSAQLPDWNFPKLAFLDIDGVLADNRHREHYVADCNDPNAHRDWESFFRSTEQNADAYWKQGRELYESLVADGWLVVYLTGRNENYRAHTLNWLEQGGFSLDYPLVMRPPSLKTRLSTWKTNVLSLAAGLDQLSDPFVDLGWIAGKYPRGSVILIDDDHLVTEAASDAGFVGVRSYWQTKPTSLIKAARA
jgi:hypothetical protein